MNKIKLFEKSTTTERQYKTSLTWNTHHQLRATERLNEKQETAVAFLFTATEQIDFYLPSLDASQL